MRIIRNISRANKKIFNSVTVSELVKSEISNPLGVRSLFNSKHPSKSHKGFPKYYIEESKFLGGKEYKDRLNLYAYKETRKGLKWTSFLRNYIYTTLSKNKKGISLQETTLESARVLKTKAVETHSLVPENANFHGIPIEVFTADLRNSSQKNNLMTKIRGKLFKLKMSFKSAEERFFRRIPPERTTTSVFGIKDNNTHFIVRKVTKPDTKPYGDSVLHIEHSLIYITKKKKEQLLSKKDTYVHLESLKTKLKSLFFFEIPQVKRSFDHKHVTSVLALLEQPHNIKALKEGKPLTDLPLLRSVFDRKIIEKFYELGIMEIIEQKGFSKILYNRPAFTKKITKESFAKDFNGAKGFEYYEKFMTKK